MNAPTKTEMTEVVVLDHRRDGGWDCRQTVIAIPSSWIVPGSLKWHRQCVEGEWIDSHVWEKTTEATTYMYAELLQIFDPEMTARRYM